MASLVDYKGLEVVDPTPTGDGGLAIDNNFKKLIDWQILAVLDRSLNTPPGSPTAGDRYIVGDTPDVGSAWEAHAGEIATWNGVTWDFVVPAAGQPVYVLGGLELVLWSGSAWAQPFLGGALTGDLDLGGNDLTNVGQVVFGTVVDNGNSGSADTIDWTAGSKQVSTLSDNCTFTFTAPSGPCSLQLILKQDATGGRTVTWPAEVKWQDGTAANLTVSASAVDIVSMLYDGTSYFATAGYNFG